ncbi:MAG: hypothetical protein GY898_21935 [Proteobacteria bacterium]|nr:hypothetical protein [Pseudomonadota bacterium]
MSGKADGVKTLDQHLQRVVTEEFIRDLDVKFHGAVRPVAEALIRAGKTFDAEAIEQLESSREIAAVTAAVHLRSLDACAFWKPLLSQAVQGSSHAPVVDLKAVSAEARALMALLNDREASEMRDKVLLMATEAAARTEKWIPDGRKKKGGGPKAVRYGRGAFHETEDEAGNPLERAATPRKVKKVKQESAVGRFFGWVFTVAVVIGLGYGVFWFIQNNQPEPMTTDDYSRLVSGVKERTIEGSEAVLKMRPAWVEQKSRDRESDIRLMLTVAKREDLKSVRMTDAGGAMVGHLKPDGTVVWGPAAQEADVRRAEQDRLQEEFEEAQRNSKKLLLEEP